MTQINIERLTRTTKKDYESVIKLLPQLTEKAKLSEEEFERVVDDPNVHMFVARDDGKIVGTGMLVITPILVERRGRLEDIVVDEAYRGKGIGTKLMEYLILAARGKGLEAIEFSSGAHRKAANALYKRMKFQQKDTNVYRMEL